MVRSCSFQVLIVFGSPPGGQIGSTATVQVVASQSKFCIESQMFLS